MTQRNTRLFLRDYFSSPSLRERENRATINLVTSRPGKVSNVPHHPLHPTTLPEMPYSAFEGRARSSTQSNRTNATMRARSVDARLAPPRLCQWREDKRAEAERERESEALCIHIGRFAVNELKLALGRQGILCYVRRVVSFSSPTPRFVRLFSALGHIKVGKQAPERVRVGTKQELLSLLRAATEKRESDGISLSLTLPRGQFSRKS